MSKKTGTPPFHFVGHFQLPLGLDLLAAHHLQAWAVVHSKAQIQAAQGQAGGLATDDHVQTHCSHLPPALRPLCAVRVGRSGNTPNTSLKRGCRGGWVSVHRYVIENVYSNINQNLIFLTLSPCIRSFSLCDHSALCTEAPITQLEISQHICNTSKNYKSTAAYPLPYSSSLGLLWQYWLGISSLQTFTTAATKMNWIVRISTIK